MNAPSSEESLSEEGYRRAIQQMHDCISEYGFLATPTERDNYRRVWGRDSCIIGATAMLTDEADLINACLRTLETLVEYQGPHGEIPSNVDPRTERVSYGGTAGRVDANLWFIIACGAYWRKTRDESFLDLFLDPIEQVRWLLGAWEFNTRGLLYIPPTGDWADEYLQSGYVLYDQLLYLQAQREVCEMHRQIHDTADHMLEEKVTRLRHLIQANYWFDTEHVPDDVYHSVLFQKGHQAAQECHGCYWMPFFSPFGYGFRFDAMANSLVTLLDVADEVRADRVDRYIAEEIVDEDFMMLPAFNPVITPKHEKWEDLQVTYSNTFKNAPYEYHNGGLWPLVTGFYVASLAKRNHGDLARKYCDGLHAGNRLSQTDEPWGFPEFVHGTKHTPGGTSPMGWSAAAAVIAEQALRGNYFF